MQFTTEYTVDPLYVTRKAMNQSVGYPAIGVLGTYWTFISRERIFENVQILMLRCLPPFDQALGQGACSPDIHGLSESCLRLLEKSDKAQDLLQTALDGRAEVLESDHPWTEQTKAGLHQLRF